MIGKPFSTSVAGGTGSGKVSVSRQIRAAVGCTQLAYLQHDSDYHNHSHLSPAAKALYNSLYLHTYLLVYSIYLCSGGTS